MKDTLFDIPPTEPPSAKRLREAKEKWRIHTIHNTDMPEPWCALLMPEGMTGEEATQFLADEFSDLESNLLVTADTELEAVLKLCRINGIEVVL
jgi:hypothetical protein